jgi:ribonuclease P protein component
MKDGVFFHAKNFYLRLLDRKDGGSTVFSFVVPGKIEKTSVGRHQVKRKMTATVEKILPMVNEGFSGLLFAKAGASALPTKEREKEIYDLLIKSGVLNGRAL